MEVSQNKKTFLNDWTMFEKMWLIISTITMIGLSIIWKDSAIALISGVTGIIGVVLCAKGKISRWKSSTYRFNNYSYISCCLNITGNEIQRAMVSMDTC